MKKPKYVIFDCNGVLVDSEILANRVEVEVKNELKSIAGVIQSLEMLNLPKCVASSSEPEYLDMKLSLTNLKKYFADAIFHVRYVKRSKPEPDLFFHAVEKMGWTAADCFAIEDSVHGVTAGKAAGMTV